MVALLPREYHLSIEIRQSCSIQEVPQSNEESIPRQRPICKKDSTLSTSWDTRGWQGLCSKKGVRFNSSRGRLRRNSLNPAESPFNRQMQLVHRRLEQFLPRCFRLAELPHFRRPHLSIARQLRPLKALQLSLACRLHPRPDRL